MVVNFTIFPGKQNSFSNKRLKHHPIRHTTRIRLNSVSTEKGIRYEREIWTLIFSLGDEVEPEISRL